MPGKKKQVKKVEEPTYENNTITKEELTNLIRHARLPSFDIDVSRKTWVPTNRVKFTQWLDASFKYPGPKQKARCHECSPDGACPSLKPDSISLFPHQKLIKDYMQFSSPYRGLLLYHGLGVGKSCSAIAAAELLMNHMDVVVMLPASLRGNFINEVKKCGRRFYGMKQHWVFVPSSVFDAPEITKIARISSSILNENKGVWVPKNSPGSHPNFHQLSAESQLQINTQIDSMINNRYKFINYNGLKLTTIIEMSKDGNPFDDKCIVVDEIHNLISRIVNGGKIGSALYKLLMSATNCKLILLSGTPIINYPYEIAYMMNLVTGPRKQYTLQVSKGSEFDVDKITSLVLENVRVDVFSCDPNMKTINFTMLPEGFKYTNRNASLVERDMTVSEKTDSQQVEELVELLKGKKINVLKKITTKEYRTLPEDEKEFNRYFVNMEKGTIVNPKMFARRILGAVSYYSTYSPELYPKLKVEESFEPMTDVQFQAYEKSRLEERKKERNSKFNKGTGGNIFKDGGQVYRFYSRANCNFVFPETIKRPLPSMKQLVNEIDDDEGGMNQLAKVVKDDTSSDESAANAKKLKLKQYDKELQQALEKLATHPNNYLHVSKIGTYSPKFLKTLQRLNDLHGTAMIYSQFRRVEGLGILAMALDANGYCEFKIKKVGGEWVMDIKEEDMAKPKYIIFTGNNEETQVLLKVFNSDMDNVPPRIREALMNNSNHAKHTNTFGDIIKVLMITQSGAEGISLKNVRQVHIMEPYWNYVRIDQVIGRAVRTCSHVDLPPEARNVTVFIYNLKFTKEQLDKSFTIRVQDNSMTSDEYIYGLAKKKASIVNMFLDTLKQASVDCALNNKGNTEEGDTKPNLKCFSFPVNLKDSNIAYMHELKDELMDEQKEKEVERREWKGEVLVTKKGNFLVRPGTNEVYDYDIYLASKKLVKVGVLKVVDNKRHIVRDE